MELQANAFVAGAKQANSAIDSLIRGNLTAGNAVNNLRGALLGLGAPAAVAGAAVVGLGVAIGGIVAKSAQLGQELFNLSQRTGETVESLSLLRFAAQQDDVSLGQVTQALRVASTRAVDAARGGKEAAAAFKRLGIDVKDANGNIKTGTALLEEIGRGLAAIPAGSERTAAAVEVLGRSGQALIPLVTGIGETRKRFEELGGVISTRFAQQSNVFGQRLGELKTLSQGFGIAIAEALLPSINEFLNTLVEVGIPALKAFKEFIIGLSFELGRQAAVFGIAAASAKKFIADITGNEAAAARASAEIAKHNETLSRTVDEFAAINAAPPAAEPIRDTQVAADEAKRALESFNLELQKFSAVPADIETTVAFFERFADALDAGNTEVLALLTNLQQLARISPEAATALREVQEAQRERLGGGVVPRGLPGGLPAPTEPILPGGGQPLPQPAIQVDTITAIATGFNDARIAAERLNEQVLTLGNIGRATFNVLDGAVTAFADGAITSIDAAAQAFADFFKQLLKDLARAIIRATILTALFSIISGGGFSIKSILKQVAGALGGPLGFQDAESSMLGRSAQARGGLLAGLAGAPALATAGGLPTPAVTVTPIVQINQANPMTWARVVDQDVMPRLRERQRHLNDDLK